MIKISPSLLAADFSNLTIPLNQCELGGASMIHIDVMDGNFVPNITMGPVIVNGIRKATDLLLDVHLMINKPENFISEFINVGSDLITFHVEATKHPLNLIKQIKDEGLKCGITLKQKICQFTNQRERLLLFLSGQIVKINYIRY